MKINSSNKRNAKEQKVYGSGENHGSDHFIGDGGLLRMSSIVVYAGTFDQERDRRRQRDMRELS